LDELWNTVGEQGPSKPVKRSTTFLDVSEYICEHLPTIPGIEEEQPISVLTHQENADSLYRILSILTGSAEVSEHVRAFLVKHPPKDYGVYWKWGLLEDEDDTD
jgi:hypothetical protein